MFGTVLPLAAAQAFVSSPALPDRRPKDVKKIDSALSGKSSLPATVQANAKSLRDKGNQLHKRGKHRESLEALHESMEALKIKH